MNILCFVINSAASFHPITKMILKNNPEEKNSVNFQFKLS